jgi:ribosomal protein S18 acetylase RimI-like enzyme
MRKVSVVNVVFERAATGDAETLVKVQIRAFHHDSVIYPGVEIGGPPGYDSVENALKKMAQDDYYKIVCDEQIVGGIVVFDFGEGHFHLDLIYIDPDYHNQGIGTRAMQFLERTYPAKKWTLDTPQYAVRNQHFYEKFGYVKVKEYEQDGFGLIAYEKRANETN